MASREGFVYIAKLAEQDERYDGKISRFRSTAALQMDPDFSIKKRWSSATPEDPSKRKFRYVPDLLDHTVPLLACRFQLAERFAVKTWEDVVEYDVVRDVASPGIS
ncbi:uncharacterized protein A4U43_C07F12410 [Asparagus officinalis]|uniref:Uncharacterized protein n=1 Tax=Asparagus officinalis TaxID=4686 RepID=A0A5P1EBG0_ASPOF|nr:uncharacterized protein A4U43_C07F12410 [Asparagus officinalis]